MVEQERENTKAVSWLVNGNIIPTSAASYLLRGDPKQLGECVFDGASPCKFVPAAHARKFSCSVRKGYCD